VIYIFARRGKFKEYCTKKSYTKEDHCHGGELFLKPGSKKSLTWQRKQVNSQTEDNNAKIYHSNVVGELLAIIEIEFQKDLENITLTSSQLKRGHQINIAKEETQKLEKLCAQRIDWSLTNGMQKDSI